VSSAASAPPPFPDASASDPAALGWMEGFPPPPERAIGVADGSAWAFPRTRWAFSHMRELFPTANVSRGDAPVALLPRAERSDLDAVAFETLDGRPMTWGESLAANYTDGIVVLHRGVTVQERYFGALQPELAHTAMSVTKSFVGTLAAMLAERGALDPGRDVTHYLPELAGTAYDGATLRQVMDMTVGVRYSEAYADPQADIWRYARAGGMLPRAPDDDETPTTLYAYLATLAREGEHGEAFAYKTVNTEVLAWVVKRVTGQRLATLTSDLLWSRLGAEHDAHYAVDSVGTESGGGGLNTTLRDLARFGEAMRQDGWFNGQQIIPERVVAGIRSGGDPARFARAGYQTTPGWSYRDMWWVTHNAHGAYTARGIHGQAIWIDPKAEMVIARYASHPLAANSPHLDPTSLPAYEALGRYLLRGG